LHSGYLSNFRFPWKRVALECFIVLKYYLSFRIIEQLALALKIEFVLKIFKPGDGRLPASPPTRFFQFGQRIAE